MGIFSDDNDSNSCPALKHPESLTVQGSSHTPMLYISIACFALTAIISVALIIIHLRRYVVPKEQRQIIRITFAPVVVTFVSVIALISYEAAQYVADIGNLYDAFALAGLYLLFVNYSITQGTFGPELFDAMHNNAAGKLKQGWPKKTWILVFQFCVVMPIVFLVEDVTVAAGVFCSNSMSPKHANFWVTVIKIISTIIAIMSVIRYYKSMKGCMRKARPVAKMICFKLVLGLSVLQQFIMNMLINFNAIKPTPTYSYGDLRYGIPMTMSAIECVILALAFHYACSSAEYSTSARPANVQRLGFFHAIIDALNPLDLLRGIGRAGLLLLGTDGQSKGGCDAARYQLDLSRGPSPVRAPPPAYGPMGHNVGDDAQMPEMQQGKWLSPGMDMEPGAYQVPSSRSGSPSPRRGGLVPDVEAGVYQSRSPSPRRGRGGRRGGGRRHHCPLDMVLGL